MGILEAESEIHRNYNSCPSARGILDLDTLSAVRLYNYNSRHSARNYFYFRQNNNISVSDITTLAHAGIKKKLAKGRCSYNSRSSVRGILCSIEKGEKTDDYNSRYSVRNYFRQSNNISVSDITTLAHAGIEKTKSTKVRCDYNSRSSTRNSSVSRKRFEMPKRRCDYNSFQSHNERYWIAPENLPKHFLKSFVYYNAHPSGAGLFCFSKRIVLYRYVDYIILFLF